MKHYPRHIGDFNRATRHLTRIERSIYSDLLDLYYESEKMLPLDINYICRKIIARTNEEVTGVVQVLNEFFTKTPTGYYQDRCEEEIERYQKNNSQQAMAGKASAAARLAKKQAKLNELPTDEPTSVQRPFNGASTELQPTINHEPINHEPINQSLGEESPKNKKLGLSNLIELGVNEQVAKDWIEVRKTKRAPLTKTALDAIVKEAEKANLSLNDAIRASVENSWQGFKADWYQNLNKQTNSQRPKTFQQMTEEEQKELRKKNAADAKRMLFGDDDFIDGVASHV